MGCHGNYRHPSTCKPLSGPNATGGFQAIHHGHLNIHEQQIKGFAFNPNQPSVTKGTTITWTNDDSATHTVTSGVPGTPSGKFDQRVEAGKTFTFTFTDTGTYEFFCSIHNSMRGTVTVK